jgi:hypothetical protein
MSISKIGIYYNFQHRLNGTFKHQPSDTGRKEKPLKIYWLILLFLVCIIFAALGISLIPVQNEEIIKIPQVITVIVSQSPVDVIEPESTPAPEINFVPLPIPEGAQNLLLIPAPPIPQEGVDNTPVDYASAVATTQENIPELASFIASVSSGSNQVTGVWVEGKLSLPIVQQPAGSDGWVSTDNGVVTQFSRPNSYNVIGLLAHNTLSGALFTTLEEGDIVHVVNGKGFESLYKITKSESYQALTPHSNFSNFIDLNDSSNTVLTVDQLFQRIYTTDGTVVFQTCIARDGDPSWGRLFITAIPIG